MPRHIYYHKNCNDGRGAALAAWLLFGDGETTYQPIQYGDDIDAGAMADQEVYFLDFCPTYEQLIALSHDAISIQVIDHHKTATEAMRNKLFPINCRVLINEEHSGAVLAWKFFSHMAMEGAPGAHLKEIPLLFLHLEDRDLWRHKMEHTDAVHTALQSYPDFRTWVRFVHDISSLVVEGRGIARFLAQKRKELMEAAHVAPFDGFDVPHINVPHFLASDMLHELLQVYPDSPFAIGYSIGQDHITCSLRSRTEDTLTDVAKIAEKHGGGGHRCAAGFKVPNTGIFLE